MAQFRLNRDEVLPRQKIPLFFVRLFLLTALVLVAIGNAPAQQVASAAQSQVVGTNFIYLPLISKDYGPTSQELIGAALDAGRIDYSTSLLYRAYALFGDPRLPPEFWGAGSAGEDQGLFYETRENNSLITPQIMALLQPFLVRPDNPESIFSSGAVAPMGEVRAASVNTLPCIRLNVWAALASSKPGVKVKVWARCDGAYEDDIRYVLGLMEDLWSPETVLMGNPIPDAGGYWGGDSDDIDIYLLDTLEAPRRGNGNLEEAFADAPSDEPFVNGTSSAYIELPRVRIHDLKFKSALAHEFFHVLQDAHNEEISFDNDLLLTPKKEWWFTEASAEWAAAHFVPETARQVVHDLRFKQGFQKSSNPLHLSVGVKDPKHDHEYQAYIWPFFMEQERGAQSIAAAWDSIAMAGRDWDLALGLISAQLPFDQNFHRFAIRNLNKAFDPGDPVSPRYVNLDPDFPDGSLPLLTADKELSAGETATSPLFPELTALTADYYHYKFQSDVGRVELDLSSIDFSQVDVDAVIKYRGKSWELRPLNGEGNMTLCDIEELYLVVSNHTTLIEDAMPVDFSVNALATPCACNHIATITSWTGSLSFAYTHSASNAEFGISLDQSSNVSFTIDQTGETYGGTSYLGPVTGLAAVHDTFTDYGPPPQTDTIFLSGQPVVDQYGEKLSQVALNVNLTDCTYNFTFTPTLRANDGSLIDVGAVRSADRPVPSLLTTLSGTAYFPAHSVIWGTQNNGEAYFPLDIGFNMFFFNLATEDNAGSANVIWSFEPGGTP